VPAGPSAGRHNPSPSPAKTGWERFELLIPAAGRFYFPLTIAFIAAIYLRTLSPFIQAGDAGELVVDAMRSIAAHPPGYPLYTILAHLFTLLPISSMAWRVGFFSLCCQVACSACLFILVKDWLRQDWIASAVTLFFSLAPLTWRYAIEPEVFALNNLFAVLLLLIVYRYQQQRSLRWAYAGCAFLGVAACNHLTILLFALPFALFFFWQDRRTLLRPTVLATGAACFAVGLLPYLSLFELGRPRLIFSWGDYSSWHGFFAQVLRREYGTFQFDPIGDANADFFANLYYFAREMCREALFVLILFWLWGVGRLGQNDSKAAFARLLTWGLVFYAVVLLLLSNVDLSVPIRYHDEARLWMLPLLSIVLVAGWGLSDLGRWLTGKYQTACLASALLLTLATGLVLNWRVQDESERDFFERVGHSMLDAVEPNAVMLIRGDTYANTMLYLQTAEGARPDVHVIRLGLLRSDWMKTLVEASVPGFRATAGAQYSLRQLFDDNIDRFPLYTTSLAIEDRPMPPGFVGLPVGFQQRIKRADNPFTLPEIRRETAPFLSLRMPDRDSYRRESWESYINDHRYQVTVAAARLMMDHSNGEADWLLMAINVLGLGLWNDRPPSASSVR
jgi:Protein of unknown function (DUF2723)